MALIDQIAGALGPNAVQQMSSQLGASPDATRNAISAALPVLLGAMQRNASRPEGAQSLHNAVVRDHVGADPMERLMGMASGMLGGQGGGLADLLGGGGQSGGAGGGLMGALGGLLGGAGGAGAAQPASRGMDGAAILGHILGGRTPQAANGVGRAAGINPGQAGQLMAMLAPMIMAALGKVTQSKQLDPGGLASELGQESARVGAAPRQQGGILDSLLDADGDGDVDASDLLSRGASIFGAFMK